ncbi:hypothetical protein U1Q18_005039, partial [Sarracenia purpurea var. burkii]
SCAFGGQVLDMEFGCLCNENSGGQVLDMEFGCFFGMRIFSKVVLSSCGVHCGILAFMLPKVIFGSHEVAVKSRSDVAPSFGFRLG